MRGSLISTLTSAKDRLREQGRFKKHPACDCCGKPCTEFFTDERVCGGGDGPGFFICGRKACSAKAQRVELEGGIEALRKLYTLQRELNNARSQDQTQ
jgi:hypothetical protein